LGVPYRTVQSWVEYYNKNGSKMFKEHRGGGKREALTEEQQAELKKRIDGGPKAEDDVCTLRGVDVQHILAQEFGVLRSCLPYMCYCIKWDIPICVLVRVIAKPMRKPKSNS